MTLLTYYNQTMQDYTKIINFLFEIAYADEVENVGWSLIRADKKPTLSQHLFRTSIIAFLIAQLEGVEDPNKLAIAGLLNRIQQTRLGDRHKITAGYIDKSPEVKDRVRHDQLSLLPDKSKKAFVKVLELSEDEKVIVKDADQISFALEAKAYVDKGYEKAHIWIDRIEQVLVTDTAKEMIRSIIKTHSCDWWEHLKKKPQTKKKDYISQI